MYSFSIMLVLVVNCSLDIDGIDPDVMFPFDLGLNNGDLLAATRRIWAL